MSQKMLVVASNLEEFVTRCGGTAARYAAQNDEVRVILLTGEEDKNGVAAELGVSAVHFMGYEADPLVMDPQKINALATIFREYRPDFIVTHCWEDDPGHPDNNAVRRAVMAAYQAASGAGYVDGNQVSPRQTPIFGMEPHDSEACGFRPMIYIDVSDTYFRKAKALQSMAIPQRAQTALAHMAQVRGDQMTRRTNSSCEFAEAFSSFGPIAKSGLFVW